MPKIASYDYREGTLVQINPPPDVLAWLDAHRTVHGSLPEKVTRTGRPAGPAPLTWTSALVLLTLTELDRG